MFRNSVRFAICGAFDAMSRCFQVPALEEALLAAASEQTASTPEDGAT